MARMKLEEYGGAVADTSKPKGYLLDHEQR